jgi:hypothetical protein
MMMQIPQMPETDQPIKNITMPLPHMMIRLLRANNTWFIANRGGFKTTMGISFFEIDCVYEMPRSTGIICGPSYEHLGDNTLNPLFNALNDLGFENGVHYVVGTKPPDEFEQPLIRVDSSKKYDHMISWHNGTNQFMVSMAKKGSANGISAQWGVFDEVKLMNERDLIDVIFPVFRGNEKHFKQSPLFMAKFFATDKLADPANIKWILNKKKHNNPQIIDIIIALQLELNTMKERYNAVGKTYREQLRPKINAIEVRLAKLRSNLTFYTEANHEHTMQILGEKWYQDKVNTMKDSPYELKVAIRNEDPDKPEDGFYPDYDDAVHAHEMMNDINPNKGFIIAPDYQHSVSPIAVAQLDKLPGATRDSLNYVQAPYTLAPKGLADAVQQFCDDNKNHPRKVAYYVYDHTARGRRNDAETYYEIVVNTLRANHWQVFEIFTGKAPNHYQKFIDTKGWLINKDGKGIPIRFNKIRCGKLITSITGAPAKMANGKTEKDKKYENTAQYPSMDQSETTHFSDCFDMINHAALKLNRIRMAAISGGSVGFGRK